MHLLLPRELACSFALLSNIVRVVRLGTGFLRVFEPGAVPLCLLHTCMSEPGVGDAVLAQALSWQRTSQDGNSGQRRTPLTACSAKAASSFTRVASGMALYRPKGTLNLVPSRRAGQTMRAHRSMARGVPVLVRMGLVGRQWQAEPPL
jgi:hypothetical protein